MKKKKESNSTEQVIRSEKELTKSEVDLIQKLTDIALHNQLDSQKYIMSFIELEIKFLNSYRNTILEEEPCKFFVRKHELWETKQRALYNRIEYLEGEFQEELIELESILDSLQKKEPSDC